MSKLPEGLKATETDTSFSAFLPLRGNLTAAENSGEEVAAEDDGIIHGTRPAFAAAIGLPTSNDALSLFLSFFLS